MSEIGATQLGALTFKIGLWSLTTLIALGLQLAGKPVCAGSATWNLNPSSGDWNTAGNWTPGTVPNGIDDVAMFAGSNVTAVTPSMFVTLGGMVFEPGASSYDISFQAFNGFNFNDAGITNNSGVTQRITASYNMTFFGHSTAGSDMIYTTTGTSFTNVTNQIGFLDSANAGSATFINNGSGSAGLSGYIYFADASSAASSFITNNGPAGFFDKPVTLFYGNSTAANSTLIFNDGSTGYFQEHATAAASTITSYQGSTVFFWQTSTAGTATLQADGDISTSKVPLTVARPGSY